MRATDWEKPFFYVDNVLVLNCFLNIFLTEQKNQINPFCAVFPTEVSCTIPNVGAAGGEQNHNGLCILSQNIINEKMYLGSI